MQPERQIPAQLPTAIQQASGNCRPFVPTANWRCPATTAMPETSPPVAAPCSVAANTGAWPGVCRPTGKAGAAVHECRRMAGSMTLLGDDTCYQEFSKNPRPRAGPSRLGTELRPGRSMEGGVKSAIGKWLRRTPLPEPELLSGAAPESDGLWSGRAPGVGN